MYIVTLLMMIRNVQWAMSSLYSLKFFLDKKDEYGNPNIQNNSLFISSQTEQTNW